MSFRIKSKKTRRESKNKNIGDTVLLNKKTDENLNQITNPYLLEKIHISKEEEKIKREYFRE